MRAYILFAHNQGRDLRYLFYKRKDIMKKWAQLMLSSMVIFSCLMSLQATANTATVNKATTASVASENSGTSVTTPVNINQATLAQLQTIKGLGPAKAQSILDYRTKNGSFATLEDIEKVPGIGPKLFEKIRPQLSLT